MDLPIAQRPRPVAVCVRCGRAHDEESFEMTAICLLPDPDGGVCGGRVTWRADPEDWQGCPSCGKTGLNDQKRCPSCSGAGWLLRPTR